MFKVYINEDLASLKTNIYFLDKENKEFITTDEENLISHKKFDVTDFKVLPLISFDGSFANEFLNAMAEALDERNIKTDKDAKIQGTLEATKYHLEDLRKMLKL